MKQLMMAIMLSLIVPKCVTAATWFVGKNGSDLNSCLQAQSTNTPKLTISAGLACLGTSPGAGASHNVEVSEGTYNESLPDLLPSGTSWSAPFTFKARAGNSVVIKGTGQNNLLIGDGRSYFTIVDGFVFDGTDLAGNYDTQLMIGTCCNAPSDLRIQNNEFRNSSDGDMIIVGRQASRVDIRNNKFHDIACSNPQGANSCGYPIYYGGSNGIIENNVIYNIPSYGVHIYAQGALPPLASNNIVRGNLIHDFGQLINTPGILLGVGSGNQAYNNVLYNGKYGISSGNGASNSKIYNNTIYNMAYVGIDTYNSVGTVVRNNIIDRSPTAINNAGASSIISNNLTGNPSFINPSGSDFRLQSGSSAIDNGANLAAEAIGSDYANGSRPQGCCYDIGAYEYGSAPAIVSSPAPQSSPPIASTLTITVDSSYTGYNSSTLNDGIINSTGGQATTWASSDSAADHWINVTFPAPRQVNTATIFWAFNNYQQKYMTAQKVDVQYWDGSSYKTVASISNTGADFPSSSVSFPAITTSQVRFLMPAGQGNPSYPNIFWLTEIGYGLSITTVDSTYPGYATSSVDDGIVNATGGQATTWASADSSNDHWVNIAFPSTQHVNNATISWAFNSYLNKHMTAKQVNVQYWDGSIYKTIASFVYPGADVPTSSISFPMITTSQLRFVMPAGQGNPSYPGIFWVTEIDYGFGSSLNPPTPPGTLLVMQ